MRWRATGRRRRKRRAPDRATSLAGQAHQGQRIGQRSAEDLRDVTAARTSRPEPRANDLRGRPTCCENARGRTSPRCHESARCGQSPKCNAFPSAMSKRVEIISRFIEQLLQWREFYAGAKRRSPGRRRSSGAPPQRETASAVPVRRLSEARLSNAAAICRPLKKTRLKHREGRLRQCKARRSLFREDCGGCSLAD